MIAHIGRRGRIEMEEVALSPPTARSKPMTRTAHTNGTDPLGVTYDDLQIVGLIATSRFAPGAGESDRVAHVRKLLDVSAELNYAISTYTHRVLMFAGRRPADGDLLDETVVLQDALVGFATRVREIADAYRALVQVPCPAEHLVEPNAGSRQGGPVLDRRDVVLPATPAR
jgi:hypothetical protein